ncbi:iron ABC transporter permease [Actinotalea sp. M2MS4P-6]|uniref:ABC transporter permease n=1 Tax=Actinotalea sp. M2MS4P-6 TaxID=2983762 RepID=UPI0021E3C57D|nr:iron ABC transporter permease [Actinotalea sp. M2MS4P-6]MCV2392997.1 iron ABC transporter permease [Actinotalea sp. M2MS4P-6]
MSAAAWPGLAARLPGRVRPGRVALWLLAAAVPLAFLTLFFALPVAGLVARGFVTDGALDLSAFADVMTRPRTWRIIGLTVAQGVVGTTVAVLLGVPGAHLLYRTRFRGRGLVRALVAVPFVLPTVVVGVAFRSVLADSGPLGFLGWDGTFAGVVMALVFFNYTVVVRTVGAFWSGLDPRAEQAARALGASPVRAFWSVTLPALAPGIASAASIVFLFCATAFGVVLVLGGVGYGTVETEIWIQTTQFLDLRAAAVLSVVQLVVVTLALAVAGRARRRREQALTRVPDGGRPLALRGADARTSDRWAVAVTAVVGVVLLGLPMVTLVLRSLHTRDGWGPGNYVALGHEGFGLGASGWEAAAMSVRVAVDATLIAVVVAGLVALVASRRPRSRGRRRAVGALDAVIMLPLGVSAVTVGFGMLVTLDRPFGLDVDLRTWPLLLPIAQAVVAVPLVVRTVLPVLRAIDTRLHEAAAVLGASPGRVLRHVDWPVAARSLGLAVGLAFAVSLGEFGATTFLVRPESPTLPVLIYRLIGRPGADNLGTALAASVLLATITAVVMALAERLRGETGGDV